MAGNDKGDPLLLEELVEAVPHFSVAVEAMARHCREKRFVKEDELVAEGPLQLLGCPFELLSGYARFLAGKLRAEEKKKRIPLRKSMVRLREEREKDAQRRLPPYVMVSRREVERLSLPRDIEEPFPLEPVPRAVYGVPSVDDRIYLLSLDGLYEGGIGRAGIAYVGVAHDGKGGVLRLDHGRLKTEEYRENKEGQPRELHGRYYIPAREKRKGCRGNDAPGRGSVFCAQPRPL